MYLFSPFWFASYINMIYMNRFYCGDWVYTGHLFVCMMIFIMLALDVTQCGTHPDTGKDDLSTCFTVFDTGVAHTHDQPFKAGVVVLYFCCGTQFWRPFFDAPESRTFCAIRISVCYASSFLWAFNTCS